MSSRKKKERQKKAFLVFRAAALDLTIVPGAYGQINLCRAPISAAVFLKSVLIFRLLLEKRLVNSNPLSVRTHSTRTSLRAYHLTKRLRSPPRRKWTAPGKLPGDESWITRQLRYTGTGAVPDQRCSGEEPASHSIGVGPSVRKISSSPYGTI